MELTTNIPLTREARVVNDTTINDSINVDSNDISESVSQNESIMDSIGTVSEERMFNKTSISQNASTTSNANTILSFSVDCKNDVQHVSEIVISDNFTVQDSVGISETVETISHKINVIDNN